MHDPSEFDKTTSHLGGDPGHSDSPADSNAAQNPPPMPEKIGRYQVTRLLGNGGFGQVYLAHDYQLKRAVAIKLPHARLVSKAQDAGAYITEAQTVASLDHPNIVPVYDVGSTSEYPCYIVSKYIEGAPLAQQFRDSYVSFAKVADLFATVAFALHHAHTRGLVHRDVKPGNILIDKKGKPYVVDFGLALRETEVGTGPRYAGTPAYMSPEQARGEGHRVDRRSDIFSLGVVLYQLLVGKRPFRAESKNELLEQIVAFEPPPPRQCNEQIPKELERICLKAMAKRADDRYPSSKHMAEELNGFLATYGLKTAASEYQLDSSHTEPLISSAQTTRSGSHPQRGIRLDGESPSMATPTSKIIPKGLRSFDEDDADFFLRLLPGPRDREGLPDSIRFWKTRIQKTEGDGTFSVGLLYGPSGCGKSSLMRAGLLPQLPRYVIPIYVESTLDDTETRLMRKLHRRFRGLSSRSNLKATIAALRQGHCLSEDNKVLMVLDQFEQWLHGRGESADEELVQALRQCDGERVQCVLLVRDDFWLATSRFMRKLEIPLVEGRNLALVDLFEASHARLVLSAFGRAFGKLPENDQETTRQQAEFLKKSVDELSEQGRINCARLALFADMMKEKPWTAATLRRVGGTKGVGVTFLEETFSKPSASPEHRYHQKAIRAVLKALLPDTGSVIKGCLRSYDELLVASGYAQRPHEFENLIRILDSEVRLITPTDPEGIDDDAAEFESTPGQRYYQLTHDYLVHSVREWLNRKQMETRRGRAQALLAERTPWWNAKPISRYLPSWWECLRIQCLTENRTWTPAQRRMMRSATRFHGLRATVLALLLVFGLWALRAGHGQFQARNLRHNLFSARLPDVPSIIDDIEPYRHWIDPLLAGDMESGDQRKQLLINLAMLPVDRSRSDSLFQEMLRGPSEAFLIIRDELAEHGDAAEFTDKLWRVVDDEDEIEVVRLRGACALATFAPDDSRWKDLGGQVANQIVMTSRFVPGPWVKALGPVREALIEPLIEIIQGDQRGALERATATSVFSQYAAEDDALISRLAARMTAEIPSGSTVEDRIRFSRRKANAAVSLLLMNQYAGARPALRHAKNPTTRTALIHGIVASEVPAEVLLPILRDESEPSIRLALLLALGESGTSVVGPRQRDSLLVHVRDTYLTDPHPGVRQAAKWLAGKWDRKELQLETHRVTYDEIDPAARWFVNSIGQVMIVIPAGKEFEYADRRDKSKEVTRRTVHIAYSFAAAEAEVTVADYAQFLMENSRITNEHSKPYGPTDECPVNNVSWFEAAAFCNWLSERDKIPRHQWCYLPNSDGEFAPGMKIAENFRSRIGYRLPTTEEFECAALGGATTDFFFGEDPTMTPHYSWCSVNSGGHTHPSLGRMPNDFGLFGTSANIWEWCQPMLKSNDAFEIADAPELIAGGTFDSTPDSLRSAERSTHHGRTLYVGFRVFRTIARPAQEPRDK